MQIFSLYWWNLSLSWYFSAEGSEEARCKLCLKNLKPDSTTLARHQDSKLHVAKISASKSCNIETHVKISEEQFLPLKEYLESYVSESQHELIRTNVLIACRNYNHRVKAFIKSVVMDKSSPMSFQYYSIMVLLTLIVVIFL